MSDVSILTAASRLSDLYRDEDRAFTMRMEARRAEEVARNHIRATRDALTWLRPRTSEESFIVAVVLGGNLFNLKIDEIDNELLVTTQRMLRNLITGMRQQFEPEKFSALPKWVLDDPMIAHRVRIVEPLADAAE